MSEEKPTEPPIDQPEGTAAPAGDRPQYEFDAAQNDIINDLAMAMLWVRLPLLFASVLEGLLAVGFAFRIRTDGAHIIGVFGHGLVAILCYLLANWLVKAAAAFVRVTTTTGRDVSHLMTGLKNLASWFDLLAFFVKMYLILLGIMLILLAVGLIAGAFKTG